MPIIDVLTDYWDGVARLTDAGGPLQLNDDVTLGVDLCSDVTDHVTPDDCHVAVQTAKPQY